MQQNHADVHQESEASCDEHEHRAGQCSEMKCIAVNFSGVWPNQCCMSVCSLTASFLLSFLLIITQGNVKQT